MSLAFVFTPLRASYAVHCETFIQSWMQLISLQAQDLANITSYETQMIQFIADDYQTATNEMLDRINEFDLNIRTWFDQTFWQDNFRPALQGFTTQYYTEKVDQTADIGKFIDAQTQSLVQTYLKRAEVQAKQRLTPSPRVCQAATANVVGMETAKMSRQVSKGLGNDAFNTMDNATGSASADGSAGELNQRWTTYQEVFCDASVNGGIGCGAMGDLPNMDVRMGDVLWGTEMSYDMSATNGGGTQIYRVMFAEALKNIVSPFADEPITEAVLNSSSGRETFMKRRSISARKQAVYNTLAQMTGMRTSGDVAPSIQAIRTAAGITDDVSAIPSYREYMEAMFQDRFRDESDIANIDNPSAVLRNQIDAKTSQMQVMNELYKRMEEMTILLAAEVSYDLDQRRQSGQSSGLQPIN